MISMVHGGCWGIDGLSLFFATPVLLLGIASLFHGKGYLRHEGGRALWRFWILDSLMILAMLGVVFARNALLFLLCWELMGLFSFLLVIFDYAKRENLKAGWSYLLACQAGGLLLIFLNGAGTGTGVVYGLLLILAGFIAFGLKAGIPGLHTWLPEAHPTAPSPVSAVMSGAMIPLGLYGIIRLIQMSGCYLLMGILLLVCGLIGAPMGILQASAQNHLKRLLAYSSVENMSVLCLGVGLSFLGNHYQQPLMTVAGLAGALLHLLNHAFLKGTLFLGAGNILHGTGTLSLDQMGGVGKRMPWSCGLVSYSAISLSGLPPFNGFLGEFLIYQTAFYGLLQKSSPWLAVGSALVILCLALTGGIAAAVYAKVIAAVFLGEARRDGAAQAEEQPKCMIWPMAGLTFLSILLIWLSPLVISPIADWFGFTPELAGKTALSLMHPLWMVVIVSTITMMGIAALGLWIQAKGRGQDYRRGPTWDCGYAKPTARMAYTGTALVQPILDLFASLLHLRRRGQKTEGLFPEKGAVEITTADSANRGIWRPLYRLSWHFADWVHRLQTGSLHFYLFIMVLALIAMLVWGFCFSQGEAK